MGLTAKQPEGSFEIVPAGLHLAICYSLVDCGHQTVEWQGVEKLQEKVALSFELCNELMDDGRPMITTAYVTNSLAPNAALRGYLEGWRSKAFTDEELAGFELTNILGKPCTLNIVHESNKVNGKTFASIKSISGVMKGTEIPETRNPIVCYDTDDHVQSIFEDLPKWLKEKISNRVKTESATPGLNDLPSGPDVGDDFDDDIPF